MISTGGEGCDDVKCVFDTRILEILETRGYCSLQFDVAVNAECVKQKSRF